MPGAEHVLDFSQGRAHLHSRYRQLIIDRPDLPEVSVPMEETAVVVLGGREVTCSQSALDGLMQAGAAVIVCDAAHMPSGMMLPLSANFEQTRRMIAQVTASLPTKKNIWKQIVVAKVLAQASVLALRFGDDAGLAALARTVRSGDPMNIEAQAAQRYWPRLFGDIEFLRRREKPDQNRLLNYGYAVLRAAVARAVCAAGLHPSLGVHHHARNNPFCLADDLMEPYRPLVDDAVAEHVGQYGPDAAVDKAAKESLVGVLHARIAHEGDGGGERSVFEWIARSASSLSRVMLDEDKTVFFPSGLLEL